MTRKPVRKTDDNRNYLMLGTGAIALGAIAGILWFGTQNILSPGPSPAPELTRTETRGPSGAATQTPAQVPPQSGGDTTRFNEALPVVPDEMAEPVPETAESDDDGLVVPFEIEEIAGALGVLQLDEEGNLVLDHTAHSLLEEAFLYRDPMDEAQLDELRALIETGLGGAAGEQAAEVAERFFRYSSAYREISDTLGMRNNPRSLKQDYEQVMRLRRTHLGPELTEQLYGPEEKLTRYTLEVMEIQSDPSLSAEEREQRQQAAADAAGVMLADSEDPDDESAATQTN